MTARRVRILVVEDSEDDARLAMRILRQGGFDPQFRRVQDIDALRDAFLREKWDAVLSDFRLPGFNGVRALEVFRETGLDIPFIFFSGTIGDKSNTGEGGEDPARYRNELKGIPIADGTKVSDVIGAKVIEADYAMKAGDSVYVMKENLARLAPVLEREL